MRRAALGLIAVALLVGGVVGLFMVDDPNSPDGVAASIAMRAGLLLGAIWLAMPQLSRIAQRFPPWLLVAIGIGVLLLIVRPKLIGYVLPLFGVLLLIQFVGWLIRPLPKTAARSKRRRESSPGP